MKLTSILNNIAQIALNKFQKPEIKKRSLLIDIETGEDIDMKTYKAKLDARSASSSTMPVLSAVSTKVLNANTPNESHTKTAMGILLAIKAKEIATGDDAQVPDEEATMPLAQKLIRTGVGSLATASAERPWALMQYRTITKLVTEKMTLRNYIINMFGPGFMTGVFVNGMRGPAVFYFQEVFNALLKKQQHIQFTDKTAENLSFSAAGVAVGGSTAIFTISKNHSYRPIAPKGLMANLHYQLEVGRHLLSTEAGRQTFLNASALAAISAASFWPLYNTYKHYLQQKEMGTVIDTNINQTILNIFNGAAAGMMSAISNYPLQVIQTLQIQQESSPFKITRDLIKTHGYNSLSNKNEPVLQTLDLTNETSSAEEFVSIFKAFYKASTYNMARMFFVTGALTLGFELSDIIFKELIKPKKLDHAKIAEEAIKALEENDKRGRGFGLS